jgi:hypothetical protein
MRENIKKQLLDALEPQNDSSQNFKFDSKQLSTDMEISIFEITGKNSKDKSYREKSKKIVSRLKGNRNAHIRKLLKTGIISVNDFCSLNDKQMDDDGYFNKLGGNEQSNNDVVKSKGGIRPPKLNIPVHNIDFGKSKKNNFI